ncbi:hypothetical protein [Xinzhou dimarhabdovirus virus 1]|uniref:hypothetical protein n=1 Tax=Xinzhou dimarhabdovirus virus 1 TaxID=1923768 RepID=UPI00090C5F40|nr:hypothetical protein [Xinzhou dimarhabdovirus virus 1]APG78848.1 hypothetical protein [Xinzhou dimarhabdovirus virus 1]
MKRILSKSWWTSKSHSHEMGESSGSHPESQSVPVSWDQGVALTEPPSAPLSSSGPFCLDLEVEAYLHVQCNRGVSVKTLSQHISQYRDAYQGELGLYGVNSIVLCLALSGVNKCQLTESSAYHFKYTSEIATVCRFFTQSDKTILFRYGRVVSKSAWSSLGIGHKTNWVFSVSLKPTRVSGLDYEKHAPKAFAELFPLMELNFSRDPETNQIILV